ncbi:unnamed protein product [Rhizophagus irregularis]|nr:unnamed protein product [Rhizophagus irregularis]
MYHSENLVLLRLILMKTTLLIILLSRFKTSKLDSSDQAAADKSIIIVQVPATTVNLAEAYLENVHETYDWLKSLRRSSNKIATRKLVDTYDANFPLEGRDESIKILFKGSKGRNGICKIFEKRKSRDSNLHPIPILANGPGTGKSRLLQELPTLLREQAKNYTTDSELLKMSTIKCTPLMLPLAMILLHQKKTFILVKRQLRCV